MVSCKTNDIASELKHISAHHIDSFDYFIETGLNDIATFMKKIEIDVTDEIMN